MKNRIADDMKDAMRQKDSVRLEAVRMLRAAIQRREIDGQEDVNDEGVLDVVQKMVKQSNESIKQFTAGDRLDLVEKEQASLDHIKGYLPEQLSKQEVESIVSVAIQEVKAQNPSDMGKVMALLKSELKGKADMSQVSRLVKDSLKAA